ncbi:MAG TPA: tetratricopeptide repeat protein [Terriglobia bacterium]|nr:tetratricopeptide repeat protein [Terriglobia bacterium]
MTGTERICVQCGRAIPWGQADCPVCKEKESFLWTLRRETLLAFILVCLIALFVITGLAAKAYHSREKALATEWYNRGEADLKAGDPASALEDFRSALVYSRDNSLYRFRLAQALIAAQRFSEARTHLLTLWEREPGSGRLNLELARLAVKESNEPEALRYYHQAIYGVWESEPEKRRREARLEMCEFLLNRGAKAQAQAELMALADELPSDPALHTQVAGLFVKAGDYDHALRQFQAALQLNRRDQAALAGAGEAAFQLEEYQKAQQYLDRAVRLNPGDIQSAQLLETSNFVLSIDPFERGLSQQEREHRVLRFFDLVFRRVRECSRKRGVDLENPKTETDLKALYDRLQELRPKLTSRFLRHHPDQVEPVMDVVFAIEDQTARECGIAAGPDKALWLVARKRKPKEQ